MQIAETIGCSVVGSELQPDLVECARDIAKRCKLDTVSFIAGDFLDFPEDEGGFDALTSVLCVLHFPLAQRPAMWAKAASLLKDGARVYLEDFFLRIDADGQRCAFSATEVELLSKEIAIDKGELPTRAEYVLALEAVGFCDIEFEDVSADWSAFVTERYGLWVSGKERTVGVHGEGTWASLEVFYRSMRTLFTSGKLGGVKLTATLKKTAP